MTAAEQPRAGARAFAQLVFVLNLSDSGINRRYYRVSTCGRYTVSKCSVTGKVVYDAWRKAEHLGHRASDAGAISLCQRHADANP